MPVQDIFKKALAEDTKVRRGGGMTSWSDSPYIIRKLPFQTDIETILHKLDKKDEEIAEIKRRNQEISERIDKMNKDISKQLNEDVSKQLDLIMNALRIAQK